MVSHGSILKGPEPEPEPERQCDTRREPPDPDPPCFSDIITR